MQGPWKAMWTVSDDAKPKGARQNLRTQGYPWENCLSLLCGLTVYPLPNRVFGVLAHVHLEVHVGLEALQRLEHRKQARVAGVAIIALGAVLANEIGPVLAAARRWTEGGERRDWGSGLGGRTPAPSPNPCSAARPPSYILRPKSSIPPSAIPCLNPRSSILNPTIPSSILTKTVVRVPEN